MRVKTRAILLLTILFPLVPLVLQAVERGDNPVVSEYEQEAIDAVVFSFHFKKASEEKVRKIIYSVAAIEAQFSESQRGPLEVNDDTGEVQFHYLVSKTEFSRISCIDGICKEVPEMRMRGITCAYSTYNFKPNLVSGSCQCAEGYRMVSDSHGLSQCVLRLQD